MELHFLPAPYFPHISHSELDEILFFPGSFLPFFLLRYLNYFLSQLSFLEGWQVGLFSFPPLFLCIFSLLLPWLCHLGFGHVVASEHQLLGQSLKLSRMHVTWLTALGWLSEHGQKVGGFQGSLLYENMAASAQSSWGLEDLGHTIFLILFFPVWTSKKQMERSCSWKKQINPLQSIFKTTL